MECEFFSAYYMPFIIAFDMLFLFFCLFVFSLCCLLEFYSNSITKKFINTTLLKTCHKRIGNFKTKEITS